MAGAAEPRQGRRRTSSTRGPEPAGTTKTVALGVRRVRQEVVAALQSWRRGGAEDEMVVACLELLLPVTSAATSPTYWRRRRSRRAAAGHDSVQPQPTTSPSLQLPGEVPLLLRLLLAKIASSLVESNV
jgi:hypothetical protein